MKQSEQFYTHIKKHYPTAYENKDMLGIKDWVEFAHSCFLAGYTQGTQDFMDQIKQEAYLK